MQTDSSNSTIYSKYIPFIRDNFRIINKQQEEVIFEPNPIQAKFAEEASGKDIILKARQQGFSSFILAVFTTDFILKENTRSIVVADIADNAEDLLERVKQYIKSYEEINHVKVPLKYNSKYELHNSAKNSKYTIGTAQHADFGRSKTVTNLHFSEAAFYSYLRKMIAGAGNALVPHGKFVIETTANGFNEFKELWDEAILGETTFKPLFYPASKFYDGDFLDFKRKEQGARMYMQEYPETAEEAFITSGESYFDNDSLRYYLTQVKEPIHV